MNENVVISAGTPVTGFARNPAQWVEVELPSKGVFYHGALPDGRVKVKKYGSDEEAVLASSSMDIRAKIASLIRTGCLLPQTFAYKVPGCGEEFVGIDGLLLEDRQAILIHQRILTYGSDVNATFTCNACKTANRQKIDIGTQLVVTTPEDIVANLNEGIEDAEQMASPDKLEPFSRKLPNSGITVRLRHFRWSDETAVLTRLRARTVKSTGSTAADKYQITTRRVQNIVDVDGLAPGQVWSTLPLAFRENYVAQFDARDGRAVDLAIEQRAVGMNSVVPTVCNGCGRGHNINILADEEFFRPSVV